MLIVVLVDLNDFKEINDKYGLQAGDLVLKEFAQLWEQLDERIGRGGALGVERNS